MWMFLFKMVILRHATKLGNQIKNLSKKTIVRFVNRKYCKKALINRKKLVNINSKTKYNFSKNNKIFINENVTRTNESIGVCSRKLKRNGQIHSCYTRDGIVHIKKNEHSRALKVHHMSFLYDAFPDLDFLRTMDLNSFMMHHLVFLVNPHIDLTNKSCCVWH